MSTTAATVLVITIGALAVGIFANLLMTVTAVRSLEARVTSLEKEATEADIRLELQSTRLVTAETQINKLSLAAMANKDFIVDPNGFVKTKH